MDEQNSLRIAALTGEILTRDRAQVRAIMHSPERSLGQKLDALQELIETMQPGEPFHSVTANSVLVAQDRILRHRVLQIAATMLQRSPRVGASSAVVDAILAALREYEIYVNSGGQDNETTNRYLSRAEALYDNLRRNYILPIIKNTENAAAQATDKTAQAPDEEPAREATQSPEPAFSPTSEQDFDRLDVQQLAAYIQNNYSGEFDISKHNSVDDMRKFAKNIWRARTSPSQDYASPGPSTPAPTTPQDWSPPTLGSSWDRRLKKLLRPSPLPLDEKKPPESAVNRKRRGTRAPPRDKRSEASSSEDDEPGYGLDQKRRREEDKNFLRLKAAELSKFAGVNERLEKIVRVTRAMQQTFDYCSCENTLSGTPAAASFVNLLRRLNIYNLSHVEMTVNFYELLYPLTLYNDDNNNILSYIFAATDYFQNCAKNFDRMRADFNAQGPFAQIDSMVMFVIKFNFLCNLQAFLGKLDGVPALGQPNVRIHTVLMMRDKIVKLAFNSLQYEIALKKTDNRQSSKHLQRLIQLMNADFNIV